jgi:hypothetical protein
MYIKKETVSVTTAADGSATAYSNVVNGRILSIQYAKDDFADGVYFTITTETSGQDLWVDMNINASETVHPRTQVHDTTGSALTLDGTRKNVAPVVVADERIKIVIAAGGNAKSGTFHITVG